MPVLELCDKHEIRELLKNSGRKLVVICFTSKNCGACRTTTPRFEAMSDQMPDVIFARVVIEREDELIEEYQIEGVPTFLFCRNGNLKYRFHGGNADFMCNKVEELRFQN
ncbi:thioredoxin-like [Leptodactylus fuscus]|uniref:thioredoxin-like n=1 Tax=Leptodactylus fuscus TaxID=238119 RepID=UPI003F4E5267